MSTISDIKQKYFGKKYTATQIKSKSQEKVDFFLKSPEQKNQLTHSACLFCSQNIFCNILQCLSSSIILCLWEHHRYWSMKLPCLPSWGITSSFLVVEMSASTQLFFANSLVCIQHFKYFVYIYQMPGSPHFATSLQIYSFPRL